MIGLEDRQALARDIDTAHQNGARLRPACQIVGIDVRTLQRWKAQQGLEAGDGRPQALRPVPSHALSPAERAALLAVANETRFASVPPARIVPMLTCESQQEQEGENHQRLGQENGFSRQGIHERTP